MDDAALEKNVQGVVVGELRKKRKGGLGLDDSSDEEDDEYEARELRRKMRKKPVRDDIAGLSELLFALVST